MNRPPSKPNTPRLHPLLQSCTCCYTPGRICLTCARWQRLYRSITQRRAVWGAQP